MVCELWLQSLFIAVFGRRSLGDLDTANYFHSLIQSKAKVIWDRTKQAPPYLSIASDPSKPRVSEKGAQNVQLLHGLRFVEQNTH